MCLLAVCKERALTYTEFTNAWTSNPHGAGFGWVEQGKCVARKGMMEHLKAWDEYQHIAKHLPHVAHFRRASVGPVNPHLTHPFQVTYTSPLALEYCSSKPLLFHNGTWSEWRTAMMLIELLSGPREGELSDTRVMAIYLSRAGIEKIHSISEKTAVVTPQGVIHSGQFTEESGVLFSNGSYGKGYTFPTSIYSTPPEPLWGFPWMHHLAMLHPEYADEACQCAPFSPLCAHHLA